MLKMKMNLLIGKMTTKDDSMKLHTFFSTKILIGCICTLLLIGFAPYFYSIAKTTISDSTSIVSGVFIGEASIDGMNEEELHSFLEHRYQEVSDRGIKVLLNEQSSLLREPPSLDADIPAQGHNRLFSYDYEKTIQNAFTIGHSDSLVNDSITRAKLLLTKQRVPITISINKEMLNALIEQAFPNQQSTAQSADIRYDKQSKQFSIVPEQSGSVFDIDNAAEQLQSGLQSGVAPTITLHIKEQSPLLFASDVQGITSDANRSVKKLTLKTDTTHIWSIGLAKAASWITVVLSTNGQPTLDIREDDIKTYLESVIAPALFIESKDPRFEVKEGKIVITTQPQDGQKLALKESIELIRDALLNEKASGEIMLPVEHQPSTLLSIPNQDAIREIVARAETDFRGSPTNRRKNIANGAARINGILIKPGEEFSLLSYLNPIDETTGFLPELVIKGNVTKPEYGGGLCQVSTTLFRAVAYAGLPITARRNHSYRVSYYEPPVGFDATIYSPAPDFKFRNDMTTPLLIHTSVKGTKISITLWGTKDGRISEVDKPTVYNIKRPPETKIIETTELEPGKKKCTEKAHAGADAYFERRVTYLSGEIKKETFKSHYVVWPAVCYVGIEKEPLDQPTTPELTGDPQNQPIESLPQTEKTAP